MKWLIAGLLLMSWNAEAKRIKVKSVSASSSYPTQEGISYAAKQVKDGKQASSWVEGDDGSGLGSWIELDLGGEFDVARARVWAGLWYSSEYWNRANRPKEVEVSFDDGAVEKHTLGDEMKVQDIAFEKSHKTSKVKFKIKQIHAGSTWADTAISEIQVFDSSDDDHAKVTKFTASSNLPPDADGNYDPANVADGIIDSMWCEADKAGDGTGEWLEFELDGNPTVSKMHMVNGIGGSMAVWMKGNRASKATLTFSDGSTEQVTIKGMFLPQDIPFKGRSTSKVRITFDEIVKGKEYNDLCISEAYFK